MSYTTENDTTEQRDEFLSKFLGTVVASSLRVFRS